MFCLTTPSLSSSKHGRLLVFFSASCTFFAVSFVVLLIDLINNDSKCSGSVTTGMFIYGALAFYFAFVALFEFLGGFLVLRRGEQLKAKTMSLFVAVVAAITFIFCTVAGLTCTFELIFKADLSCLEGDWHGSFYALGVLLGLAVLLNLLFFVLGVHFSADERRKEKAAFPPQFVVTIPVDFLQEKKVPLP